MLTPTFHGLTECQAGRAPKVGVVLANLGTPDAPTTPALRRYLAEFLWDPRIIEISRPLWWLILNGIVLNTRPRKSAANYKKVWMDEGSPLLVYSKAQRDALEQRLREAYGDQVVVDIAMRYGNPTIESVMKRMLDQGVQKLLLIPMFPQYSATTTGSTFDGVAQVLSSFRWIPDLRMVMQYHDHPGYIAALVNSIRERWDSEGRPDKLLLSYHGIPLRYFEGGDPYHCHCHKTSRLIAEALQLKKEEYITCFQSTFGRERWLRPGTIQMVEELAKSGLKKLDVICPGFSADCLETIEEIDQENREAFLHNGGEQFRYIPCLNARPDIIDALTAIVKDNLSGWVTPEETRDREKEQKCLHAGRAHYEIIRAQGDNVR